MMKRHRAGGVVLIAIAAGACAPAAPPPPVDPVDEARVLLTDLVAAEGDVVCAATGVESDRQWSTRTPDLAAIADARRSYPPSRDTPRAELNLSQASAQMSQAWEWAKASDAAAAAGTPGAILRSHWARAEFDAFARLAADPAARSPRDGATGPLNADWASLQYAVVWSDYFSQPAGADRDALLDWLTTRSLRSALVLREYHADFSQALSGPCG